MLRELLTQHHKDSGDSLLKMSEKIGVSKAAVASWLKGNRSPTPMSIRKVCRGLGWSIETEEMLLGIRKSQRIEEVTAPVVSEYRHRLTDEFWDLMGELEAEFPDNFLEIPETDERLIRIREIIGANDRSASKKYDKQKVEAIRIERDISGMELSRMLGLREKWYTATFRRNEIFSERNAHMLAEALGVSPEDFLKGDGE